MMKKLILSLTSLLGLSLLIACGSDSTKQIHNSGGEQVAVCPPMSQMGPYGCVPQENLAPDAIEGKVSFIMEHNNPYGQEIGQMSLTGAEDYKYFIRKALQTCDRDQWNYGTSNCDAWIQGYQSVMISFDGATDNQATVQISSYPINTGFNFQASLWPQTFGMAFNPLILGMHVHNWNADKGFELRSNGSNFNEAYGSLIQIQVREGKLTTSQTYLDVEMLFEGRVIARGRMQRCHSLGCGFH